jgi:asparagine synthase (glutamine-hydrolysing)
MVEAVAHRGPDDRDVLTIGAATLGHARLSILDLSPAGHQPMGTEDGRYWLSFNGEIYNFAVLRRELEARGARFRSATDTEVLLAGYAAWGPAVFERLNGIWALALWDARDETLVLSRDRFGVKPLYVVESGGRLAFASEIKALLTLPWVVAEPDETVVREFLLAEAVDRGDDTFLRGIRRARAATVESHHHGTFVRQRYWDPRRLSDDSSYGEKVGDQGLVDRFRETFIQAVERQLQSDVPVGSCLSGGIDSSSIVSAASALRQGSLVEGTSAGLSRVEFPHLGFFARFTDEALDEYPFARAVAVATGTDLRVVTPDAEMFFSALVPTVRAQDEPFGSASIVAQYLVMSLAREAGIKVLLDGQGGDELLGGYKWYLGPRLRGANLARNPRLVAGTVKAVAAGHIPLPKAYEAARRLLAGLAGARPHTSRLAAFAGPRVAAASPPGNGDPSPSGSMLSRVLWKDVVSGNLPALLRYEDRNSMAFSIEARVPFLDHEVVDLAFSLPDRLKINPDTTKSVLRRAMSGLVVEAVLERRDKLGFKPPQDAWLRTVLPRLRPLGRTSCAESLGFLRSGGVGEVLDAFAARRLGDRDTWRVINLELWLRLLRGDDPLPA